MRSLLFLLIFLVSNVAVAGSCNGECRTEKGVVWNKCTVSCPADMVASCGCKSCYCSHPSPPAPKPSGYSVNIYHYRYQGNWIFDQHTHWTICVTSDNNRTGRECDLINARITDGRKFRLFPLVTDCVGDNAYKVPHDDKLIQGGCKFK